MAKGLPSVAILLGYLETAVCHMSRCPCMLPATYARGLCDVCDTCQAQIVSDEGSDDPSDGAVELRQAALIRKVMPLIAWPWKGTFVIGCIKKPDCGCFRCRK